MADIILVHGAFHGPWCFDRLMPLLSERGHQVKAVALPGHSMRSEDSAAVGLTDYADAIIEEIYACGEAPLVVGHSLAGMAISAVGERVADKISGLAYIAAYLPKSGESPLTIEGRHPNPQMMGALKPSACFGYADIDRDAATELFYHDCTAAQKDACAERLSLQPGAPLLTPVSLTEEGFGSLAKTYILCERDRVILPAAQEAMVATRSDVNVVRFDTGHSPFMSAPNLLADALEDAAMGRTLGAPCAAVA